jgi:hypothetical protein
MTTDYYKQVNELKIQVCDIDTNRNHSGRMDQS